MQLAHSDIFINEDFSEIGIISSITNFFTKVYKSIRKLPVRAIQILLILTLILFVALLSPIFYLLILIWLKKYSKAISLIDSNLPKLSISELLEIQKSMYSKFEEKGINPNDLIIQQNDAPLFIKPLVSVVNEFLHQFNELNARIDLRVKSHYDLFAEALKTNTMIGDNEDL